MSGVFFSHRTDGCISPLKGNSARVRVQRAVPLARPTPRPTRPGGEAMATAEGLALDELVAPMHFSPQLEAAIQEAHTYST